MIVFRLANPVQEKQDAVIRDTAEECSEMASSLALTGEALSAGVTRFGNEACEEVMINADYVPPPYIRPQEDLQDLKSYFQRPRLFRRGTVAFASRANQFNDAIGLTFLTTNFPQWLNRLSGVYGVRFTMHFRMQLAATAFHQGLLAMAFQYGNDSANTLKYRRHLNSSSSTNLPHVRLDPTESTMCELVVPFLYDYDFYPVNGSVEYDTLGTVSMNSILPTISVAGLAPYSYEVYVWLEDMEFFGADNNAVTTITLQSGSIMAKELRSSKLISQTLDSASRIATIVNNNVPLLSAIAGPTAWALDIGARIAKYFGFSKPMIQDPSMRMLRQWYANDSHVDVAMTGYNVGAFQSNTLTVDGTLGATNVDEMALGYVFKQYSQICVGSVTTANTHGTVVYASPVTPSVFWFRAPATAPFCNYQPPISAAGLISNSGNAILPSTLMAVSSYFRLWRGTIVFRFTFAKTKFHGGRYMVSYNPLNNIRNSFSTISSIQGPEVVGGLVQPYGYSLIMDLKDGNVFEFPVPYVLETPWQTFSGDSGGISIVCIDPLQANSSVTTTVPFMVEVCGGDDYDVADYGTCPFVPFSNGTVYQQSGDIKTSPNTGGANAVVHSTTVDPCQHTIGERFMSLKQCLMVPSYTTSILNAATTITTILPPWWTSSTNQSILDGGGGLPLNVATTFTGSTQTAASLARMYAYVRGSTDYHIYAPFSSPGSALFIAEELPTEGSTVVLANSSNNRTNYAGTPKVLSYGDTPLHVRIPAFQRVPRLRPWVLDSSKFTRLLGNTPVVSTQQLGHFTRLRANNGAVAGSVLIGCSAGDDATMAGFIGPEPFVVVNALNTNPLFPDWFVG